MSTFARRSMLMTPGNRLERMLKAASLGADALVFDLEDSVPPEQKPAARSTVARALQQAADAGKELCVRVNSLGSGHGLADLQAIPWHLADSIMIPKVESAEELLRFEHALGECNGLEGRNGPIEFVVMLETPRGIFNALAITDATERTTALFFGSGDYTSAMNARPLPDVLQYPRSVVCAAAGARGIQAIDAAYFLKVKDADATREDAVQARQFGFAGKVVFHPAQIDVVNEVFTPTADEIREASLIVDAYEAARAKGLGTLVVEGHFVAIDLVLPARRRLELARRLNLIPGSPV